MGNVLLCLLTILVGNIAIRFAYELVLIVLVIWRNTSDISKKLNCVEIKKVEAKKEETAKAE